MSVAAPDSRRALSTRVRAFLAFVGTPADAALLARMVGWRVCLPVLKYMLPLPRLVRLMARRPRRGPREPPRERRIAILATWPYRPTAAPAAHDNCLERSLLAYRYLAREGAQPRLVVGMRGGPSEEMRGHVWVTVDDRALNETPDSLASFAPLVSFDASGAKRAESPTP